MTIKELKDVLHLLDNDDKIVIDGKSLMVHEQKYNWNTYIRFEEHENIEQLTHEERIKYLQIAWTMEFKLDKAQEKRLKEWQDKIKELFGKYGQYDYIFTPCAIGIALRVVSHLTKTELDLSEVEKW